MSSGGPRKFCFCATRAAALCAAVYKVIFTSICLILSAVGAVKYKEVPEDYSYDDARIHKVIGDALIALAVYCSLLLGFNAMLLWAVIKRKTGPIKWWIRLTIVIEVVTCSSMFMSSWDTLRSFCLMLNFAVSIFILRAVCAYQKTLISETKGSVLKMKGSEDDQLSHHRLSSENIRSSESPLPTTLEEEKAPQEI